MNFQEIDQAVLFFINGLHSPYFDAFFWCGTNALSYIPLYIFTVYLLSKQFGKKVWIPILAIILVLLISDVSCNSIKHAVTRLRPTHDPEISQWIHIVNGYRGGKFSFPSAHACNTFALSVFLFQIVRPKNWIFTLALCFWVGIMTYSRVYLGVHYPSDILAGIALGSFIGYFIAILLKKTILKEKFSKK